MESQAEGPADPVGQACSSASIHRWAREPSSGPSPANCAVKAAQTFFAEHSDLLVLEIIAGAAALSRAFMQTGFQAIAVDHKVVSRGHRVARYDLTNWVQVLLLEQHLSNLMALRLVAFRQDSH